VRPPPDKGGRKVSEPSVGEGEGETYCKKKDRLQDTSMVGKYRIVTGGHLKKNAAFMVGSGNGNRSGGSGSMQITQMQD